MKFVTLAVTLLLAIGSQAASVQVDQPSPLAHVRAAADVYLTQIKESAKRALDQLDDTEYKDFKVLLSSHLDELHTQIKTLQGSVSPITDGVASTLAEITQQFRHDVQVDIDALKAEIEPQKTKLKEIIDKHIEEYRVLLEPVITEYHATHTAQIEALKTKLEPIIEDLKDKVTLNVEETKGALIPIIESVRNKIGARLLDLKENIKPYVDDYKDQFKQAYNQAKSIKSEDLSALTEKISPLVEEIKGKFQNIFEIVFATFNKS
ncbi:apolipoprotein A-Ib [Syngnathoides biaculeatus]|uniref:apolipoprotein A-Ib n=1 Tax=Syngnathoides biaculeatus TaxID=300417 RepID=UPI002ADD5822|nr:apolipoprotein A-Ib [Syngnathoides biaculeatus]